MYPDDLKYTSEHEWARRENGRVRVGITRFAAERLTDIVFVELPQVGSRVEFMGTFGVVESVKAVSDLYSPVTGKVVEVNEKLRDRPELVNQDPMGEGWMIVVEMTAPSEWDRLLSAQDYMKMIGEA